MDEHLAELNPAQRDAATTIDVPLLILAGAGAGKTKTITHRILHIVKNGTAPDRILAVTFTNKAAKEMRERIESLLRSDKSLNFPISSRTLPYTATFHALGVRIIRENAQALDLPRHFTIYDRADSMSAIKQAVRDAGLDPKQFEPRKLLSGISRQKGKGVALAQFAAAVGNEYFPGILVDVWQRYEKALREDRALDFDDLLLRTLELLRSHQDIRERYQSLWEYIHVDEYQDTNAVQYEIMKILAEKHRRICCVGDIDQVIYAWRGATIDNILQFEKAFPDAMIILLEENYRSTQTIVHVSNEIIKKNVKRKDKTLFTKNAEGDKMTLFSGYDEADEATYVALRAKELIKEGREPKDIAVLYRANFQSRVLEEAFLSTDVPYRVLGTKFFERKEVKDVLSFIRAGLNVENQLEIQADVRRVINVPARGIGKVTMLKLLEGKKDELSPAVRAKVDEFYGLLTNIGDTARREKPSKTVAYVLDKTGIMLSLTRDEEDQERLENIRELASLATRFDDLPPEEGIAALLENAALQSDQDELEKEENAVALMTIHAAKGLEFPVVFITGLEDGLFPHQRFGEDGHDEEEERRLFYVALTRAKEKVYLCYAQTRMVFGSRQVNMPSEFITDIDDAFLESDERPASASAVIYID